MFKEKRGWLKRKAEEENTFNGIPKYLFNFDDIKETSHTSITADTRIDIEITDKFKIENIHPVIKEYFIFLYKEGKENIKEKWNEYKMFCGQILPEYCKIMNVIDRECMSSDGELSDSDNDIDYSELIRVKIGIVHIYIEFIKSLNLFELNIYYFSNKDSISCSNCGSEIVDADNENIYCKQCGHYDDTNNNLKEQIEIISENVAKSSTDVIKNMTLWLKRFLGTSGEKYPVELFSKLDEICIKNSYPTGEEIRTKKLKQPNLEFLLSLLKESGYSKYYKLKNIIRHDYWNWDLPKMNEEEIKRFILDVEITQPLCKEFSKSKQNLREEIRGYYHIKNQEVKGVLKEDFKLPKSEKTLKDADELWEKVCNTCKESRIKFYSVR